MPGWRVETEGGTICLNPKGRPELQGRAAHKKKPLVTRDPTPGDWKALPSVKGGGREGEEKKKAPTIEELCRGKI